MSAIRSVEAFPVQFMLLFFALAMIFAVLIFLSPIFTVSLFVALLFATWFVMYLQWQTERHQQKHNTDSKSAELAALYRAISVLFSADDVDDMAAQIAAAVVDEFGHVDCGVMLLFKGSNELMRLGRTGEYSVGASHPLHVDGPGLVPTAFREAKTIYVADTSQDPRYVIGNSKTRSELVMPLKTPHGIVGVLDLQSTELNAFSQKDQRILAAFAEKAAIALENLILHNELQAQVEDLEDRVLHRTQQLQRITERVIAILNNSSDAIVFARQDGQIRQVNFAFEKQFYYRDDAAFGMPLQQLVAADHHNTMQACLEKTVNSKKDTFLEVTAQRADGTTFPAEIGLGVIYEANTVGVVCNIRDITTHKQAEQALTAALENEKELNELKTRFISMVSHEFRTPLTTIQLSANTLQQYMDHLDAAKREMRFQNIHNQINHMVTLLDDVLVIGRAESGRLDYRPEQLDIVMFCQTIVEDFKNASPGVDLIFEHEADIGSIEADPTLLRYILTNLLSNAVKYSRGQGVVALRLRYDNGFLVMEVEDNGIGIPKRDQAKLFQPFHRASNVNGIEGTGLGLLVTHHAVDAHSGKLAFQSEVGVGTTFSVHLPASGTKQHP